MPISCLVTRSWRSIVCAAVGVIGVMFAGASALAQGPLPSGNLVLNPSAQNGTSDWSPEGQFSVRSLAMPGSPDSLSFWGGTSAVARGTQLISVSNWRGKINQGCVVMTLSALLGGWQTQSDNATVRVDFLTSDFFTISSATIGPVSVTDRGSTTRMMHRAGSWNVPAGTENLRVVVSCNRVSGTNNDGYADDISVVLNTTSTAPLPPDNFPIIQDSPAVASIGGTMALRAADPNLLGQCGLYYQWYRNGQKMNDQIGPGRKVFGSQTGSLTIESLSVEDLRAAYQLGIVPVSVGQNFSSPQTRFSQIPILSQECQVLPTSSISPVNAVVARGGGVVFRATTNAVPPPISGGTVTYRWYRIYTQPPVLGIFDDITPVFIPLTDGVLDRGQTVQGANTLTLRLGNLQEFSDQKNFFFTPSGGNEPADYSIYALRVTTPCRDFFINARVFELTTPAPGVGFNPSESSVGGVLNTGSSGGAVTGSVVRSTASGGGGTSGGFGFALASITATITPTPYGSLLEITRSGSVGGDGSGGVFMTLALEVDERMVWTIEPEGVTPDISVDFSSAGSGVFSSAQPSRISITARPDLQGEFVWRLALARDPRITEVPLKDLADPRWTASRTNAIGESWFVIDQSSIEFVSFEPSAAVPCGSDAFATTAFTRSFQSLDSFSISGTATVLNPPLAPATGTSILAMQVLDASEDAIASVMFADNSTTGSGAVDVKAGQTVQQAGVPLAPGQSVAYALTRSGSGVQTVSGALTAADVDVRPARSLRFVSGYLPLECAGEPSAAFEGLRWSAALLTGNRTCRADLNFDDVVDNSDFVVFAAAYSIFSCEEWEMIPGCASDLNDDQTVDNADFVLFANAYSDFLCP